MQPIFLLAAMGAAIAMGIGYLGNDIALEGMVQEFGVGEGTLEIPIDSANVAAKIVRTGVGLNFKDIIVECIFISPNVTIEKGTMIFCKLLDEREDVSSIANVIAEGIKITDTVPPNVTVTIPITFLACEFCNDLDVVHDLLVIFKGP